MTTNVLASLNKALHDVMAENESVYILGEDILDPYGGAFKVTKGLSTKFPERVLTTPISEAGITGIAIGMSLRGLRPVVEIMFGDFLTLAADQLINHAAKFQWMYNEKVSVPIVVRTPMGGRRGYGPTHSQSIEKLFLGIPGLTVVAPSFIGSPGDLLLAAINDDGPVLFIEHKLLYSHNLLDVTKDLVDFKFLSNGGKYPTYVLQSEYPAAVTIASYGYNLDIILAAARELIIDHEIFCDIVIFTQLSPFTLDLLIESLKKTGKLLTVEEGTLTLGWGAEITSRVLQTSDVRAVKRIAAKDLPIANARTLEEKILPSAGDVVKAVIDLNRDL